MFRLDKKNFWLLSGICLISFSSLALSDSEKTQIDKQIGDYLQKNPESVYGALVNYQHKQEVAAQQAIEKSIRDRKQEFFGNKVSPILGNPKGTITAVEFQDYQCGHCKMMGKVVDKMVEKNPKDLRVVVKEMPIFGKVSEYAARAALAAGKQGKFKEMHKALLTWEPSGTGKKKKGLREKDVDRMAKDLGLDVKQLKKDMHDKAFNKELKDVKRLAKVIGLRGTPYFIFADKSGKQIINVPSGLTEEDFQATIDILLGKPKEDKDAKSKDSKSKDAKSKDSKSKDAKSKDSKSKDAKSKDSKSEDAKSKDSKSKDAKSKDSKSEDAKKANK